MIKVLRKNSTQFVDMSLSELEEMMGFQWEKSLVFQTPLIEQKVLMSVSKALRKKQITPKEKFLGVNFGEKLSKGLHPDVSIRWVDEKIGYGVFAETDIPSGSFIGEYTGLVRKRKGRPDRSNDYCFEYGIGDWRRNPFIIDARETGNITRFINHSAEPNLESVSVYANECMHIILISITPIQKGAQLSYDYGATYWKKRRGRLLDNI